jgi:hypothetical protein
MTLFRTNRAAGVVLYSVLLVAPPDCVAKPPEFVFHRFALSGCPQQTFALPTSVSQAPFELVPPPRRHSWSPANPPRCPGFKGYGLRENGQEQGYPGWGLNVRLNRGPSSCTLDVAYTASSLEQSERPERIAQWAEAAARLAVQGSGIVPIVPAERTERRKSTDDLRPWCEQSANRAGWPRTDPHLAAIPGIVHMLADHQPLSWSSRGVVPGDTARRAAASLVNGYAAGRDAPYSPWCAQP